MKYALLFILLLILASCGQSSSGSRNPGTEIVMDLFTGYQSGQYISSNGELYGVSTGGPTALSIQRFDNDFCLLLLGPPKKTNRSDIEYITGQKCKNRKFGYYDWKVQYSKYNKKQLFLIPLQSAGESNGKVITITYNGPQQWIF